MTTLEADKKYFYWAIYHNLKFEIDFKSLVQASSL